MNSTIDFKTVPHIIQSFGINKNLGSILKEHVKGTRIAVITDQFLSQSGLLTPALESLKQNGWQITLIDDVIADPPENVILEATKKAQAANVEVIVGLGGGSSMDVAKLLAVLVPGQQELSTMYGIGQIHSERLPLIQMPTTAGTGSEVTAVSIVTTGATTKSGVVSPKLIADLAILDAELTLELPPHITAATGIDAMVHAIEAFTTKHLKNPISDMLAKEALRLLSTHLLTACQTPHNQQAREGMLLGAMYAGQAFANAPVGAVHALAYPLGGIYHIPHGLSNSLVLPHVLRFNSPQARALYAELAACVIPDVRGTEAERCEAFISYMEKLPQDTQLPNRLRDLDIPESALETLANDAMKQTRLLGNNPRDVTLSDALAIYRSAW